MDGAQRRGRGRRLSKASGCEAAWVNAADNANTVVGVGEEGSGMARGGGARWFMLDERTKGDGHSRRSARHHAGRGHADGGRAMFRG